jgi:ABC-type nitrate/sulfonate/bicarbonate transport system permease component
MIGRATVEKLILPLGLLAAWEIGGRAGLLPIYLSRPSAIAAAIVELTRSGELPRSLAVSLLRAYAGFALGAALGVLLGLAAGMTAAIRNFFDPLVSFLYPIPKIAFLSVLLLLFGLGNGSQIAIIALGVFFPIFVAARYAVLAVNPIFLWAGRNMGAGGATIFLRVVLPAAAPQLFAGLRVGLAHAFVLLFAAELIGARNGLGYLIVEGEEAVRFDLMFAGIAAFALIGFASDRILMAIRPLMLRGQALGTEEQIP